MRCNYYHGQCLFLSCIACPIKRAYNKGVIDTKKEIEYAKKRYEEELKKFLSYKCEKPKWIPCSEQVPSDAIHVDDMVLVCYENGEIRFNSFMDGQWVQEKPIVWMPLPDPYKKEGKAD